MGPSADNENSSRRAMKVNISQREATYLFGVSLSSVKHHASAWTLPLSTQGNDNRGVEMTVVVLLYRTNLSYSVKTHPWCIRVDRLPKPLEEL